MHTAHEKTQNKTKSIIGVGKRGDGTYPHLRVLWLIPRRLALVPLARRAAHVQEAERRRGTGVVHGVQADEGRLLADADDFGPGDGGGAGGRDCYGPVWGV